MIVSFECEVSDKLKKSLENYVHPKNTLLQLTDDLFVENKVYYYGNMVLVVEIGMFDIIAQYFAYFGVIGLLFSWFIGNYQLWMGIPYISFLVIAVCLSYLSSKVRFYLLRWRIHEVVDKDLKMTWLSKEQVITRFIHGVKQDEPK